MKSTAYQIFLIGIFLCSPPIVQAQDVDEIIAMHIEAHGGTEKWEAVKSMKITGKFTAFSEEKDIHILKTDNGEYYSELYMGQFKVKEAFNGKAGWTIDPWHEFLFPRELNKPEVNVFYQKAEFFTPFYKYKEKGHEVELLGKQNIDGIDVYAIKLTRPNGKSETWYLDANTYLEYKCESEWVGFAYDAPAESYFEDFRSVDGLVIPFYTERTFRQRDRITQIENIGFNTEIDKGLFEMPRSEKIKKLAFLEGDWDVKFEIWTRRGSWHNLDNTTSSIKFIATNLLQEKINYDMNYVQSKIIDYTYNSSTEKYRITVFNGFSSDIEVFEGDFTDSTFSAENTNISYGDSIQNGTFSQIEISKIEKDSFIVEIKRSNDKGETWKPREKLSYNRREDLGDR